MQTPFVCYFSVPFLEKLVFVSKSLALPLDAAAAQRSSGAVAFPLCSRTWNNRVSPGAGAARRGRPCGNSQTEYLATLGSPLFCRH